MAAPGDTITNFLLNAPPGEFHDVVSDVRNLLGGDDTVLNEVAPYAFKEYNTEQLLVVNVDGQKTVISKHGELSASEYLAPRLGLVVSFDHFKQEVTSSRPIEGELDADAEQWRAAVSQKVEGYISEHYDLGAFDVFSQNNGASFVLTVCISSAYFNPSSFYNGRWRSIWTIEVAPGKTATVSGHIRVNVHYYEDGNVQLNTNTIKKKTIPATNAARFGEEAAKAIKELEQDFQQQLEISYDAMNDTTFKALRRALPMTRQKIQWAKIGQYKLGQEIQK
jgi:capping protein alpha